MKIRYYAAAAALTITLAAVGVACGHSTSNNGSPNGNSPEPAAGNSVPLMNTAWFTGHFGTPLLADNDQLVPRAVEQAKDLHGIALPQDHAALDGPVMWQRVNCEALPFTTTDGPTRLRGEAIYGGFTHTPLGAALAAYHLRNFGGTATTTSVIPTIAAPADRDRVTPELHLDQTQIPADMTSPDCLAHYGIRRPARWHAEQLGHDTTLVSLWYPGDTPDSQGYTTDITVVWAGGDWYLTDQSIGDIGYSGQQKQPTPAIEPAGWSRC